MNDDQKAAILRAADWIEANPERHIAGTLARDQNGSICEPNDPDAFCFCALGRMFVELSPLAPNGIGTDDYATIIAAAGFDGTTDDLGAIADCIYGTNDLMSHRKRIKLGDDTYTAGNPDVANYLRNLVA